MLKIDGLRKKELREQYRQSRPEMGVFAFRCKATGKVYLGASQNLAGAFNSVRFQLQTNSFLANRRIQADWKQYGQDGFSVETLEILDYDKDNESKTDYKEDLAVLKEFWREQLEAQGATVENIKPKDL